MTCNVTGWLMHDNDKNERGGIENILTMRGESMKNLGDSWVFMKRNSIIGGVPKEGLARMFMHTWLNYFLIIMCIPEL